MSTIESAFLKNQKTSKEGDIFEEIDDISEVNDLSKSSVKEKNKNKPKSKPKTVKDSIARMKQSRSYTKEECSQLGLISKDSKDQVLMNEYRNLRTKLLAESESENFVTLVTSVSPDYDSSLVTANIASTFSLDEGKTSLYINTNARSDLANEIFDIEPSYGLVDYIESDKLPIDDIIYETPISRLRYIPIGINHENSAEHFSDVRMKKTMASIVKRYPERYIFVNAPSISSSADTRILLDICHKVILIVPYGIASEDSIREAVLSIGKEKFAGILLEEF